MRSCLDLFLCLISPTLSPPLTLPQFSGTYIALAGDKRPRQGLVWALPELPPQRTTSPVVQLLPPGAAGNARGGTGKILLWSSPALKAPALAPSPERRKLGALERLIELVLLPRSPLGFPRRPAALGRGAPSRRVLRRLTIMTSFEDTETEETVTCLYITLYHPCQEEKQVFRSLKFNKREQLRADEVAKFGRDSNVCHYNLMDSRVSRVQFALQFFRRLNSSELGFEIKNMSKKTKLIVENVELDYLNKIDLPWKCIIRFGDYQLLMERRDGESVNYFETHFELAQASLLQERHLPSLQPIPEYGISPSLLHSQEVKPVEVDENDL